MTGPKQVQPSPFYRHHIGLDQASSLTNMPDEAAVHLLNMEAEESGRLSSRPGTDMLFYDKNADPPVQYRLPGRVNKIFDFQHSDGKQYLLAWSSEEDNFNKVYNITDTDADPNPPILLFTPEGDTENLVPGIAVNNDVCIWGDGQRANKKFYKKSDGINTETHDLSVPAPQAYPPLNIFGGGNITTTTADGQRYTVTFFNEHTGEESNPYNTGDLSQAPKSLTISNSSVQITKPAVPVDSFGLIPDPQVTHWRVYKTNDGESGTFYRHTVLDNDTYGILINNSSVTDNQLQPNTTIELQIDNDPAPISEYWAAFEGSLFCVPKDNPTLLRYSKIAYNSSFPLINEMNIGAKDNDVIMGLKNKNNLLWIMKRYSTWVLNAHPKTGATPTKVADRGTVHKDAFDGSDQEVYSFSSNASIYAFKPTEFGLSEIRYQYRSRNIQSLLDSVDKNNLDKVRVVNYRAKTKNQIFFGIPFGVNADTITRVCVFDTVLSKLNPSQESWWPYQFMFDATSMDLARVDGEDVILFGDTSGNVFRFPGGSTIDGDGAEENGRVVFTSSSDSLLLTDLQSVQSDQFNGLYVTIVSGVGAGQSRKLIGNSGAILIVESDWEEKPVGYHEDPNQISTYTIGGYCKEYFSNWKNFGMEAVRKMMRFIRVVAKPGGAYGVDLLFKRDFELGDGQVRSVEVAGSAIWGSSHWGDFEWGASGAVREKVKVTGKFNSCQIGFRNETAGQPFSIEGFTTHHQELYLGSKQ